MVTISTEMLPLPATRSLPPASGTTREISTPPVGVTVGAGPAVLDRTGRWADRDHQGHGLPPSDSKLR